MAKIGEIIERQRFQGIAPAHAAARREKAAQLSRVQTAKPDALTAAMLGSVGLTTPRPTDNAFAAAAWDSQRQHAELTATTPTTDPAAAWQRTRGTGVVRGGGYSSAAGAVNFAGLGVDTAGQMLDAFETEGYDRAGRQAASYRRILETGRMTDGRALNDATRRAVEEALARAEGTLVKTPAPAAFSERHPLIAGTTDALYGAADDLAEKSAREIALAKDGLGTAGQFAVDVGVAGTQMLGDMGAGLLTGGGALPAMFVRAAGGGAQEARQSGGTFMDQLGYGVSSGLLSVASEKLVNVAAPFRAAFGGGVLDGAISKVAGRLGSTAAGRLALSALSEGGEEFAEAVFQPVLRRATFDQDARFDLERALYDAAIGAALGGVGGGVELVGNKLSGPPVGARRSGLETGADSARRSGEGMGAPRAGEGIQGRLDAKSAAPEGGAGTAVRADTSLFDKNILANLTTARQYFVQYARNHFPATVKNTETGREISISRVGIDKFLSGRINHDKYASGFHIPELVERATLVGQAENYHPETAGSIPTFEYYDSPIEIDGKQFNAHIRVKNTNVGDKYYGHTISEVDDIKIEPPTRVPSSETLTGQPEKTGGSIEPSARTSAEAVQPVYAIDGPVQVEGTRPLDSDYSVPQGADFVNPGEELGAPGAQKAAQMGNPTRPAAWGEGGRTERADIPRLRGMEQSAASPDVGAAVNENGLAALTEREQINLSSGKKNKIVSTFQEAVTFIQNALFNKQSVDRAYLGKVPETVVQAVSRSTGLDIRGFGVMMNGNDVRHIIKDHGDALMEAARGQVAVTPEDIARIPEILSSPDRVYLSDETDAKGRNALVFEKQIGDKYITIQGISDGKKVLQADTLYIRKGRTRTTRDTMPGAREGAVPVINAQGEPPQSSSFTDFTVPQGVDFVNPGDVLAAEAQRLFGRPGADPLQGDGTGGTMEKTTEKGDSDGPAARAESREAFYRRGAGEGGEGIFQIVEGRNGAFGYRPVQRRPQAAAEQIQKALQSLGVSCAVTDGTVLWNKDGITGQSVHNQAVTVDGKIVLISDNADIPPLQVAGHEAFHFWKSTPARQQYVDTLQENILYTSEDFLHYQNILMEDYFGGDVDLGDAKKQAKFLEELFAYLSGDIHEGVNDDHLRPMFRDYDAVKAAWEQMMEKARQSGGDGLGAADAGFDPYSRLQNQTSRFHPEGAHAARPVDVPTENFDGSRVPKAASTVLGAQGLDGQDVRFLERQIAEGKLAFDTIRDADSVARARGVMEDKGFDGALEQYRQAVRSGVATKDNTTLGQQLLLQAMREGNAAYTAELLSLYTRNSTTAAQSMQAQSIFRKLSPEGQLAAVQRAVDALNEKHGTDVTLDEGDVADFLDAAAEDQRQAVRERMLDKAAEAVPGTFKAKFDTLRYLAMLGNPKTHIRNILGNTLFQPVAAVKNRVGALEEAAAYRVSGGKTERTKALLGANPFGALAKEAHGDWVNVRDFLGSASKYAEQTSLWNIEERADAFSDKNPVGRGINALSDLNSRALEAEDMAAKRLIYAQSLAGYLKANGIASIREADPALLNRARTYAAQEAMRNTFNDKNAVSDAVSKLGGAARSGNPAVRAAGYVVEGVLPFKRTPANILVRAAEYGPVGVGLGILDTVRGARSGDTAQISKGLDRLASGLTGTALLSLGALAAGAGMVTGGGDEDERQAAFDDLTGHQPYALELKNGTSFTLDWLAPEAIPFFMGVELYSAAADGRLSLEDLGGMLKNATAPMLEMSMLQGLNDVFDNAAYAKNRGESVLGNVLASALTSYLTQVFPTLGGQIERIGEEVRMTTYTDKNSAIPTDLQYTLGKVSAKVPGWDYHQTPYIDAWGREEESGDLLTRLLVNTVSPGYISQVEVDKVEAELQRLADATGKTAVFPARAARYLTVDGVRRDLTAEEYETYARTLGKERYALVQEAMGLPAYRSMSDAEKTEFVGRLYDYAAETAKSAVTGKATTEPWVLHAKSARRELGVSTAEYLALYRQYGSEIMSGSGYEKTREAVRAGLTVEEYAALKAGLDADGNGGVSQAEARAALDAGGFSREKKADLWTMINKGWKTNPYT